MNIAMRLCIHMHTFHTLYNIHTYIHTYINACVTYVCTNIIIYHYNYNYTPIVYKVLYIQTYNYTKEPPGTIYGNSFYDNAILENDNFIFTFFKLFF